MDSYWCWLIGLAAVVWYGLAAALVKCGFTDAFRNPACRPTETDYLVEWLLSPILVPLIAIQVLAVIVGRLLMPDRSGIEILPPRDGSGMTPVPPQGGSGTAPPKPSGGYNPFHGSWHRP